ncbi:MAG: hypothetical protein JWP71_3231 [Mucilaginibacter sp.]|nr:hypothetical protein [Mucilaginibacter sp.]
MKTLIKTTDYEFTIVYHSGYPGNRMGARFLPLFGRWYNPRIAGNCSNCITIRINKKTNNTLMIN